MQQSSSLPEHNSQIDRMSQLLPNPQQVEDNLYLESSLNQLQSRLNEVVLSAYSCPQVISAESELMQAVVNEVATAFNRTTSELVRYLVGIAQCQPQEEISKICYFCSFGTTKKNHFLAKTKLSKKSGSELKLHADIEVKDLQEMEKQEPATAWRLADDSHKMMMWLIVVVSGMNSHGTYQQSSLDQVRSQFMQRTVKYCNTALAHLRQIQSLQQRCQHLANINQELERSNQLKNQFLANTSHEIRTPLSSIIGFTHLLLAQGYEPERQRHQEYLQIIKSSGKHLLDLINDILDLSKIEANQLEVQWEIIDVPILCKNVLALVKEKAANKGLKLCLEIGDDVTNLLADPLRLKQMLLNLLFNAVKFTKSGSVGLRVKRQDLHLKFTIWDTGIGISPENQSLLFRPYSQILDPGAESNEGTGLGLMVTKQLVQIHGGLLTVESEVNQGSQFVITLPLKPEGKVLEAIENKAVKDLELRENKVDVSGNSYNGSIPSCSSAILVVEDDLANGELMGIYLSRLGYQVTCVRSAGEMWKMLPNIDPIVILMDVILPDENGLNVVEQLKKHPQYQNKYVVAQTAMAMKGDRETCIAAGFDDYISKPIDLEILGNIVNRYSEICR
ncbi:MAG: response regulator [Nostocales cyanobacterium]|nr:MAG: response regulator [Nostocales cyanobacterium]TAF14098.1 MAG: response regulator [Nostocales cyanobacterium]